MRIGRWEDWNVRGATALAVLVLGTAPVAAGRTPHQHSVLKTQSSSGPTSKILVAAYYFPDYHPSQTQIELRKPPGWTEWDLLKAGRPLFPGHRQPRTPIWGYEDESEPAVMAKKIDAAADHGIDAFIFDWYWYNDKPNLERCLDEGFLKAVNNKRLKFALMWANHDRYDVFPMTSNPGRLLAKGAVNDGQFDDACNHVVNAYFKRANYLKIDGKPYFSIYELYHLVSSLGGVERTRAALDRFREKAREAGFPGIYFNAVAWGLEGGEKRKALGDPAAAIKELGIDSVTSYVWVHHAPLPELQTPYLLQRDDYFAYWDQAETRFGVPYFPNVMMGWDPTPRRYQPFRVVVGNDPEEFRIALRMTKKRLEEQPGGPRMLTIYAWNEWTEGGYLEPDTESGNAYMDAIQDVFGDSD